MNGRFTGRIGASFESVLRKNGIRHQRFDRNTGVSREVLNVGGGCSEILTGERLAQILEPSFELQKETMAALNNNQSAPCLSNHTSGGVAQNLDKFTQALSRHLPWSNLNQKNESNEEDWFVSLQTEGASAVWAACDLLLQVQLNDNSSLPTTKRKLVAVGAKSYHGPGSTSFGSAAPLGSKPGSISYPVPSMLSPGSTVEQQVSIEVQAKRALDEWFDLHSRDVAVLLVEPQWGSSQVALPWPPEVLHYLVTSAKERGIMVCADEIMCGLGRHGKGGMFLSAHGSGEYSIAELVDAVTFGKAIAGGWGDLLSGVAVKHGASHLTQSQRSVLQSHTYAGASTRSLSVASEVLQEMSNIEQYVAKGEEVVERALNKLAVESNGAVVVQGQGLLWGGIFATSSPQERQAAVRCFRQHCNRLNVEAYPVNDGFMITPPLDAALCNQDLEAAMDKVVEAALATVDEMGWLATPPRQLHMAMQF